MPSAFGHAELVSGDVEDQTDPSMRSSRRRDSREIASRPSLNLSRPKAAVLVAQGVFVLVCFYTLLRHGLELSEAYALSAPGLRPGWIWGRQVDLSDLQWRGFREGIGPMVVVFGVFGGVSRFLFGHRTHQDTRILASSASSDGPRGQGATGGRQRVTYVVISSIGFLLYLHGRCAVYVYGLVSLSWLFARWLKGAPLPSKLKTVLVWVWHVGVLMVVKTTDGFLATSSTSLASSTRFTPSISWLYGLDEALSGCLRWLLGHPVSRGVFRWEVCYNITMLRLISQNLDVVWGTTEQKQRKENEEAQQFDEGDTEGKVKRRDDGYWLAVAHALYPPLYIAGPIITYSDFVRQILGLDQELIAAGPSRTGNAGPSGGNARSKGPSGMVTERVTTYALRTAFDVLVIELMSHYLYFNSIATNNLLTKGAVTSVTPVTPLDVATCGWWVLACTWLKFCVIWRFFRLAALVEGICPPENMRKCFAMNYDVQGFWKNWHASFNRWLVKYMYVPAGGSRYQLLMVWPIFIFVALWHDVEVRLLGWAGLMILAFMPELLVKRAFARPRWDWVRRDHPTALWIAKSLAATVTISSLMVGNMVGFVVGLDGVGAFLRQLLGSPMLVTTSLVSFFCAASLMLTFENWLYWGR